MAGKRTVKLETIGDCHRFLAKVINRYNREEIDSAQAGRFAYMVNILVGIIKDNDFEKRIADLESAVLEKKRSP